LSQSSLEHLGLNHSGLEKDSEGIESVCPLCELMYTMLARSNFLAIVIGFYLTVGVAQITDFIEQKEIGDVKTKAMTALLHPATVSDAYFATRILKSINAVEYNCNCAAIEKFLGQPTSSLAAYYGVSTAATCGCNLRPSEEVVHAAINGIQVSNRYIYFKALLKISRIFLTIKYLCLSRSPAV
jgi:hypothetical protein